MFIKASQTAILSTYIVPQKIHIAILKNDSKHSVEPQVGQVKKMTRDKARALVLEYPSALICQVPCVPQEQHTLHHTMQFGLLHSGGYCIAFLQSL